MNEFIYLCTARSHDEDNLNIKTFPVLWEAFELMVKVRKAQLLTNPEVTEIDLKKAIENEVYEQKVFTKHFNAYQPSSRQTSVLLAMTHEFVTAGIEPDNVKTNVAALFYGHEKHAMASCLTDVSGGIDENAKLRIVASAVSWAWKAAAEDGNE